MCVRLSAGIDPLSLPEEIKSDIGLNSYILQYDCFPANRAMRSVAGGCGESRRAEKITLCRISDKSIKPNRKAGFRRAISSCEVRAQPTRSHASRGISRMCVMLFSLPARCRYLKRRSIFSDNPNISHCRRPGYIRVRSVPLLRLRGLVSPPS